MINDCLKNRTLINWYLFAPKHPSSNIRTCSRSTLSTTKGRNKTGNNLTTRIQLYNPPWHLISVLNNLLAQSYFLMSWFLSQSQKVMIKISCGTFLILKTKIETSLLHDFELFFWEVRRRLLVEFVDIDFCHLVIKKRKCLKMNQINYICHCMFELINVDVSLKLTFYRLDNIIFDSNMQHTM